MDEGAIRRAVGLLRRQPRATLLVPAYIFIVILGIVDYETPRDFSFLIFYLIPVVVVTFFVGSWAGVLASLAATATWFMANYDELFPQAQSIIPYWNFAEKLGVFLLLTCILAALRRALEVEERAAGIDPLTGLPDGRRLREALAAEIVRARRFAHPFSFALVDLDDFRGVNERRGRAVGDAVLRGIAGGLSRAIRDVDMAARLGPEEFAVLLPETGPDAARTVVRRLQEELDSATRELGAPVTLTVGLCTYLSPVHSVDEVVGNADRLMYAGKSAGKNTFVQKNFGGADSLPGA